jgi:porin
LTGDWGGGRKTLKDAGIDLGVNDTAETFSNPVGGTKADDDLSGAADAVSQSRPRTTRELAGATFYAAGFQISGRGLSRSAVGNLLAISTIEALPSTRLHDLWPQQEVLDRRVSLRVGQITLDDEFYISQYSATSSTRHSAVRTSCLPT